MRVKYLGMSEELESFVASDVTEMENTATNEMRKLFLLVREPLDPHKAENPPIAPRTLSRSSPTMPPHGGLRGRDVSHKWYLKGFLRLVVRVNADRVNPNGVYSGDPR